MFKQVITMVALGVLMVLAACGSPTPTTAPTAVPQPTTAVESTTAPAATAATEATTAAPSGGAQLIVVSHDSFSVSEDVLKAFESANNVTVQILKSGDAGSAL